MEAKPRKINIHPTSNQHTSVVAVGAVHCVVVPFAREAFILSIRASNAWLTLSSTLKVRDLADSDM